MGDATGALLILLAVGVVLAVVLRRRPAADGVDALRADVRSLLERVEAENRALGARLDGIDMRVAQSQSVSHDLAKDIFLRLGDVRTATDAVASQAREFTRLQDLLKAPKLRGGVGEAMLAELLGQVLPPSAYEIQYRFSTGAIVDAAVKAGGRVICIDSKFPLENHQRIADAADEVERARAERAFAADVEKHIKDIADRYILPDEGTLDFAVMYVPAEGLYGEVLRLSAGGRPLFETALRAKVIPMSPLTMYGYLQTILFGLRCLQIEKNAEKILGFCGRLEQDIARFADDYRKLGVHIGNARNCYESGGTRLERFRANLEGVADLADDEDPPSLELFGG